MTPHEAINNLNQECAIAQHRCGCKINRTDCESCYIWTAIKALEKQIPQKPRVTVASHNVESYWCANCDGYIANTYDDRIGTRGNNCKWCGQAIDWSDTE